MIVTIVIRLVTVQVVATGVNLFIFAAIIFNFHVLLMECQFVAIYFCISLACPVSYNGCIKFSWQFVFAKVFVLRILLSKKNRFTVLFKLFFSNHNRAIS